MAIVLVLVSITVVISIGVGTWATANEDKCAMELFSKNYTMLDKGDSRYLTTQSSPPMVYFERSTELTTVGSGELCIHLEVINITAWSLVLGTGKKFTAWRPVFDDVTCGQDVEFLEAFEDSDGWMKDPTASSCSYLYFLETSNPETNQQLLPNEIVKDRTYKFKGGVKVALLKVPWSSWCSLTIRYTVKETCDISAALARKNFIAESFHKLSTAAPLPALKLSVLSLIVLLPWIQ